MMRSSYAPEDVTILLKDITGQIEPLPASERERRIQSGTHYCEMLPLEYKPSEAYMEAYRSAEAHTRQPPRRQSAFWRRSSTGRKAIHWC